MGMESFNAMPQNEENEAPLSAEEIKILRDLTNENRKEASEEQIELQKRWSKYGTVFAPKQEKKAA
jgi:hypothetical protein